MNLFQGQKEVVIAGEGSINASFLSENLVDEIYLDVESVIFWGGVQLFHGDEFENKLAFLGMKNITKNEIQLHYRILR